VQSVLAVLTREPNAPLPTALAARVFFGTLVDTAIVHFGSVSRAAWPVDVIEITRAGITELRYQSPDEMRAAAELERG
jgi:hypothetical protein